MGSVGSVEGGRLGGQGRQEILDFGESDFAKRKRSGGNFKAFQDGFQSQIQNLKSKILSVPCSELRVKSSLLTNDK